MTCTGPACAGGRKGGRKERKEAELLAGPGRAGLAGPGGGQAGQEEVLRRGAWGVRAKDRDSPVLPLGEEPVLSGGQPGLLMAGLLPSPASTIFIHFVDGRFPTLIVATLGETRVGEEVKRALNGSSKSRQNITQQLI